MVAESGSPICVLTVAGSDSGGGAGIQADLKTFAAFRVHGLSAITAVTAQSTVEVRGVHAVPAAFVQQQLDVLEDDFSIGAMKTGMLADPGVVEIVDDFVHRRRVPLVVDPVMVASSGARLVNEEVVDALKRLFGRARVVTPNLDEVEVLTGRRPDDEASMVSCGEAILDWGPEAVLVKGGHLAGDPVDVLVSRGAPPKRWIQPRIATRAGHGTGCTYAAGIAAGLARDDALEVAVDRAWAYVQGALRHAPAGLGAGAGPLHHLWPYYEGLEAKERLG